MLRHQGTGQWSGPLSSIREVTAEAVILPTRSVFLCHGYAMWCCLWFCLTSLNSTQPFHLDFCCQDCGSMREACLLWDPLVSFFLPVLPLAQGHLSRAEKEEGWSPLLLASHTLSHLLPKPSSSLNGLHMFLCVGGKSEGLVLFLLLTPVHPSGTCGISRLLPA